MENPQVKTEKITYSILNFAYFIGLSFFINFAYWLEKQKSNVQVSQ